LVGVAGRIEESRVCAVTASEERKRVVVVGGGVIGLCCAYYIARSGREVVVLERGREDGNNCSSENAGMVVPSHFTPLAAPGVVTQGLKWLLDRESPFYVRPRLSLELMRWGWTFLRHANSRHAAGCVGLLRDLHLASRAAFEELANDIDFGLQQLGLLMLCETDKLLEEEAALAERAREMNLRVEVCDRARLAELDPNIEMQVKGGVWYEQDCHLDPGRFLLGLKGELVRMGGEIRYGCEVTSIADCGVLLEGGEELKGEMIVLAGGAWTPALAKMLKMRVPMQAGKGYSLTLREPRQLPRLCSLLGEAKVAVTPMGSSLRIAGTMEICGNDLSVNERRVQGIIKAACRVFPALSPENFDGLKRWSGLRPCSPDGLPYLGRVPGHENVIVATGHAMMGLSLGPVTGMLVSDLVMGREPSHSLEQLSPGRFS
jgi:D-amino-acid dehydrogenase